MLGTIVNALAIIGGIPTGLLALFDIFDAASTARTSRQRAGHSLAAVSGGSSGELASIAACGPIPCSLGRAGP